MAKWSGIVGFTEEANNRGIVKKTYIEKPYTGDFFRNNRRLQNGVSVNDSITINNEISIVADSYLSGNFHKIRYATYQGIKWKVETVDVQHPRLILNLGGEYVNG